MSRDSRPVRKNLKRHPFREFEPALASGFLCSPPPNAMTRLSFSQLVSLATVAFVALVTVNGTQITRRPDGHRSHKRSLPTNHTLDADTLQKRANGKASFGYYPNWSVDRNFSESSKSLLFSRLIQRNLVQSLPMLSLPLSHAGVLLNTLFLSSSIIYRHSLCLRRH